VFDQGVVKGSQKDFTVFDAAHVQDDVSTWKEFSLNNMLDSFPR
jgi:hypothetical protein